MPVVLFQHSAMWRASKEALSTSGATTAMGSRSPAWSENRYSRSSTLLVPSSRSSTHLPVMRAPGGPSLSWYWIVTAWAGAAPAPVSAIDSALKSRPEPVPAASVAFSVPARPPSAARTSLTFATVSAAPKR